MKLKKLAQKNNENRLRERVKELEDACPFPNLSTFFEENITLIRKFLKKDTYKMEVDDWQDVPEHWFIRGQEGLLVSGIKDKPYTIIQKLEWIKCGLDVVYFTVKYFKIISVDDGIIPFRLYDYQKELLALFQENLHIIAMQARQSGKTTTTAAFICHFAIFSSAKNCAILANKGEQAQEILERIQTGYELLPYFIQPGLRVYNKRSMTLSHKSKIFTASTSSSSIRGKSISLLYIDECAHIQNDMEFYESTYPTIASGKRSRVIISSTPKGARGLFYKLWTESVDGTNEFVSKLVNWRMVPGRDQEWKRKTIANTSEEQFNQEHECCFRGSQHTLVNVNTLQQLVNRKPIEEKNEGDIKVYKNPEEKHMYAMTVDVSRGVGNDYHAISVVDITEEPYEVVCTYRNNTLSTLMLPNIIYNIAMTYNEAYVLIELNDIGEQVANDMFYEMEYENLLQVTLEKNKQIVGNGGNNRMGVRTTTAVKSLGCDRAKSMIENDNIILNDDNIINELGTFVPKGKSFEAEQGSHDDMVMTIVLFAWLSTQSFFIDMTDINMKDSLMRSMNESAMDELMPFGFIDSNEFGTFSGSEALMEEDPESFGTF